MNDYLLRNIVITIIKDVFSKIITTQSDYIQRKWALRWSNIWQVFCSLTWRQCAAVRTSFRLIRDPPQNQDTLSSFNLEPRMAIHGWEPLSASWPPTTKTNNNFWIYTEFLFSHLLWALVIRWAIDCFAIISVTSLLLWLFLSRLPLLPHWGSLSILLQQTRSDVDDKLLSK